MKGRKAGGGSCEERGPPPAALGRDARRGPLPPGGTAPALAASHVMEAPPDGRPGGGMAAAGVGAEAAVGRSGGDSGNVSQSHSNASGLGGQEDEEGDALDASLSATAAAYSAYLLVERSAFSEQVGGAGGVSPLRARPSAVLLVSALGGCAP